MKFSINKPAPVVIPPPTIFVELSLREAELLKVLMGIQSTWNVMEEVNSALKNTMYAETFKGISPIKSGSVDMNFTSDFYRTLIQATAAAKEA